ncbi:MAG: arabinofuranosidase catalytic domain-containing protein [Polyangia bacterium]
MRNKSAWSQISLIAIVGLCGWGCTIKNGGDTGTGGDNGSGGSPTSGSGGSTGSGGTSSGSGGSGATTGCGNPTPAQDATGPGTAAGSKLGPCDIYAADGGPCVAAHSTVRALYGAYNGPLYQVRKAAPDCTAKDIYPLEAGGFANSGDQETFCGTGACTISLIYDQSGKGNHLTHAPGGGAKTTPDNEAKASGVSATFSGHKVYGVHIVSGIGYRNNSPSGTATGDNPETEYMVVGGSLYNGACCFDYGNMETTSRDDGEGTMEAVYFGTCTIWGKGADNGPWVMGDLENGLWAGDSSPYNKNVPVTYPYITGMVKGDVAGANHWAIKIGNAQSGTLFSAFDGHRPSSRYNPMRKEGAIGLGTGGDNSNGAQGNFFEGVMTAKFASDKADDDVQANIVAAYGGQ